MSRSNFACSEGIIIQAHKVVYQTERDSKVLTHHHNLMPDNELEWLMGFWIIKLNFVDDGIGDNFLSAQDRFAVGITESIQ